MSGIADQKQNLDLPTMFNLDDTSKSERTRRSDKGKRKIGDVASDMIGKDELDAPDFQGDCGFRPLR